MGEGGGGREADIGAVGEGAEEGLLGGPGLSARFGAAELEAGGGQAGDSGFAALRAEGLGQGFPGPSREREGRRVVSAALRAASQSAANSGCLARRFARGLPLAHRLRSGRRFQRYSIGDRRE